MWNQNLKTPVGRYGNSWLIHILPLIWTIKHNTAAVAHTTLGNVYNTTKGDHLPCAEENHGRKNCLNSDAFYYLKNALIMTVVVLFDILYNQVPFYIL